MELPTRFHPSDIRSKVFCAGSAYASNRNTHEIEHSSAAVQGWYPPLLCSVQKTAWKSHLKTEVRTFKQVSIKCYKNTYIAVLCYLFYVDT